MSQFQYHQFLYGSDNYGVLMHDAETGQTAAIDAGDLDSYLAALDQTGWSLSHILVTHHHGDHTEGLAMLAAQTGRLFMALQAISLVMRRLKTAWSMAIS